MAPQAPDPTTIAAVHVIMDAHAIGLLSGAIGGVARILSNMGLSGPKALMASVVMSALATWLWVYSNSAWSRGSAVDIFIGWTVLLVTVAGVFKLTDSASGALASGKSALDMVRGKVSSSDTKDPTP